MNLFKRTMACVLATVLLIITLSACRVADDDFRPKSYEAAKEDVRTIAASINPKKIPVEIDPNDQFDVDLTHDTVSLPNLSAFPFVVNPMTASYIAVYSTDPVIIKAANDFNSAGLIVDGEPVSVGVRAIDSALGVNLIIADRFAPDVFVPRSELYGGILSFRSKQCELLIDTTTRGVSGVVVSNKTGVTTFSDLIRRVHAGELFIGYVDPLQDPDGMNFIFSALYEFDSAQPLGESATEGLRQLLNSVRLTANDGAQLKRSFLSNHLDGYVLNYDTFKGASEYSSGYTFISFGLPQNNPVYAVGNLSPIKRRAAELFAEFCKNAGDMAATDPVVADYSSSIGIALSSAVAGRLTNAYRSVKGGSSHTAAVFVVDISGSMEGKALRRVKSGMLALTNQIDPRNSIGIVLYDHNVFIPLPIAPFDDLQQSFYSNAVSKMATNGGNTATYDAVAVGLNMLLEYQAEKPDTKLMLFLLTDGNRNTGIVTEKVINEIIGGLKIPVYPIGYEPEKGGLNAEPLVRMSIINEALYLDAGSDDIDYKLASLLGAHA